MLKAKVASIAICIMNGAENVARRQAGGVLARDGWILQSQLFSGERYRRGSQLMVWFYCKLLSPTPTHIVTTRIPGKLCKDAVWVGGQAQFSFLADSRLLVV